MYLPVSSQSILVRMKLHVIKEGRPEESWWEKCRLFIDFLGIARRCGATKQAGTGEGDMLQCRHLHSCFPWKAVLRR